MCARHIVVRTYSTLFLSMNLFSLNFQSPLTLAQPMHKLKLRVLHPFQLPIPYKHKPYTLGTGFKPTSTEVRVMWMEAELVTDWLTVAKWKPPPQIVHRFAKFYMSYFNTGFVLGSYLSVHQTQVHSYTPHPPPSGWGCDPGRRLPAQIHYTPSNQCPWTGSASADCLFWESE